VGLPHFLVLPHFYLILPQKTVCVAVGDANMLLYSLLNQPIPWADNFKLSIDIIFKANKNLLTADTA